MNHSLEEILHVERQLQQAMVKNDVQALERLLHDDLVFTFYTGAIVGKQEDLASHASHTLQLTELAFVEPPVTRYRPVGNQQRRLLTRFHTDSPSLYSSLNTHFTTEVFPPPCTSHMGNLTDEY